MYALLAQILQPYTLLVVCLMLAIAALWRNRNNARRSAVVVSLLALLLYAGSTPLAGQAALRSLERRYPPQQLAPTSEDTLVVLSGSTVFTSEDGSTVRLGNESASRCLYARELYGRAGGCRIVLSGGKVDASQPGPTLAAAMADFLVALGVDRDHLVLEERSSSTYENALYTSPLLADQPDSATTFLVTDATHMHRSVLCFQAQGIYVTPAPCGHRSLRSTTTPRSFLPAVEGVSGVNDAAHEWLGTLWYRLRGRI
jgi:uncharacterized SAM-binding protein YcdF (DUF218 family)